MARSISDQDETRRILLQQMLDYQRYQPFKQFIRQHRRWYSDRLDDLLSLAHAYVHTDLKSIEILAPKVGMTFLTRPSLLQRRVYSYTQGLAIKLEVHEYDDYLRALTPLLVDILRLVIETTLLPDLDRYLTEVVKETVDGKPLYRGLQWNQALIEEEPNPIQVTWKRYYGDYFNYSHYVSSSHLLKIIDDHVEDPTIRQVAGRMRKVEKYARNIVAHELVFVDDHWLEYRLGMNGQDIHQLLMQLNQVAGLTDAQQWQGLVKIQEAIEQELAAVFLNGSDQ